MAQTRREVLTIHKVSRRDGVCFIILRLGEQTFPRQKYPLDDDHLVRKGDLVEATLSADGKELEQVRWRTRSRRRFPEES